MLHIWMNDQQKKIIIIMMICHKPWGVTARCPAVCECPAEPPVCPPGVSSVSDRCGCCKVCAAQLNQDCSPARPCDHHKGLECNYGNDRLICVFSAKSEGRTCEYNGRIYQNGESFRAGCKHQCTCIDGAVGCAPLCSNKLPPASPSCPYPRLVRIPGQCCFTVDCNKGTCQPAYRLWSPLKENKCAVQTTDWSPCSRSCGMGVSSRLTNKNPQCKMERQTRICTIRPWTERDLNEGMRQTQTGTIKGKTCSPTEKVAEPIHLSYGECVSIRLYRPNYCGVCTDGRCCSPRRTRTVPVTFACPDGERFQRLSMLIQSCKCSKNHHGVIAISLYMA
uniref:Protein CYR61-like n=1 Tax=Neolamprologus brichardi TaxID=32507 RepID=A0A3Q4GG17_NEOBR